MGLVEVYGTAAAWNNALLRAPVSGKECLYYHYIVEEYLYQGQYGNKGGYRWIKIQDSAASVPFLLSDETGSVLVDERGAEVEISRMDRIQELRSGTRRTREYLIQPGDRLHIIGTAVRNVFTKPGSAQSSMMNVMIGKKGSNPYYISDKPEIELREKLYAVSSLQIYGGAILSITCLLIIFGIITTPGG